MANLMERLLLQTILSPRGPADGNMGTSLPSRGPVENRQETSPRPRSPMDVASGLLGGNQPIVNGQFDYGAPGFYGDLSYNDYNEFALMVYEDLLSSGENPLENPTFSAMRDFRRARFEELMGMQEAPQESGGFRFGDDLLNRLGQMIEPLRNREAEQRSQEAGQNLLLDLLRGFKKEPN